MAGHRAGVDSARNVVRACAQKGVEVVTLFAFGQDNWQRPAKEISYLHSLLHLLLQREVKELAQRNIRLHIIGELTHINAKLAEQIQKAVSLTKDNTGMSLVIAFNYSGCWDITEAARKLAVAVLQGQLTPDEITQDLFAQHLSTQALPSPDLLIRTSGEYRLSNFLLWQLAYTELYFTDVYWPDFTEAHLDAALHDFALRERRFGKVNEVDT